MTSAFEMHGDSRPIALKRIVSEFSRTWLSNYDVVNERKMSKTELETSNRILSRRLGATLLAKRQVILDSLKGLKLEPREERALKALVADALGAHEVGGGDYFGHFSLYCHLRDAIPFNLCVQNELYVHAYVLQPLSRAYVTAREESAYFANTMHGLTDTEWFAEMLALVSERRRWHEHMLGNWGILQKGFIKGMIDRIDSTAGQLSTHGIALLVWNKLHQKFGDRIMEILSILRTYQLLTQNSGNTRRLVKLASVTAPAVPDSPFRFDDTQPIYAAGQMGRLNPSWLLFGLLDDSTPPDLCYTLPRLSKYELFCEDTRRRGQSHGVFAEFPELKAIFVGELWLALNSIVQVQYLAGDAGTYAICLDRHSRFLCSSDAQRLAIDLLHFRTLVFDAFSFQSPRRRNGIHLDIGTSKIYEYLGGRISLRRLFRPEDDHSAQCIVLHADRLAALEDRFLSLRKRLKKYYSENRTKIDKYLKHPEDFFSKVVPAS